MPGGEVDIIIPMLEKIYFNAQSIYQVREGRTLYSGKRNSLSGNCNNSELWYITSSELPKKKKKKNLDKPRM